ncbi:preli-like isoform X2 [Tachypleus tridentatus]|uniref:preli-like isoform X2 n=2 Tax=Tachypleus tridentatus TaxID=6853 RepID=UPI003FD6A272
MRTFLFETRGLRDEQRERNHKTYHRNITFVVETEGSRMGKFYEGTNTFRFTWDQVAQAFWARYPNPYSQHVLSEDVFHRYIEDGKLYTKRLLQKTNRLPKWGEKIIGASCRSVFVVEESVVDPKNKIVTTYTRNIGMISLMVVEEKCVYRPSKENLRWTAIVRQAWVSSSVYGFGRAIQAFGVERFKQNANKAIRGYQYVLEHMFQAGTQQETGMPIFVDKDRLRERAKQATQFAKSKTVPIVAQCATNGQ